MKLALKRQNVAEVEKVFKSISKQYYQGIQSRSDYLKFQTQFERSKLGMLSLELEVSEAMEDLKKHLQLSVQPELEDGDTYFQKYFQKQTQQLQDRSEEEPYYQVAFQSLTQDLNRLKGDLLLKEEGPEIGIQAELGYGSDAYVRTGQSWADRDQAYWNLGFNLKWNIFDWGYRESLKKQGLLELKRLEINTGSEVIEGRLRLRKRKDEIQSLTAQLVLVEDIYRAESEIHKFSLRDFQEGKESYLSYSTSLADYFLNQNLRNQVRFSLYLAQFQTTHEMGVLSEDTIQ